MPGGAEPGVAGPGLPAGEPGALPASEPLALLPEAEAESDPERIKNK